MKLYCSAGISHFLIYPNGDIYRCLADYNAKRKPLGNLLIDGLAISESAEVCTHPKCYAVCDADWATKWIVDDKGKTKRRIDAQIAIAKTGNPKVKFWASQDYPDRLLRKFAHIIWTPSLLCNYNCTYCGCAHGHKNIQKDFLSSCPELSAKQWISVFNEFILCRFDWVTFTITGGEPFLSESLIPVLEVISEKCGITITSNLSMKVMDFVRKKIKPLDLKTFTGVCFTGSLHPMASKFNFEIFLSKLLYLKNNGYPCSVNFVAYPEQMYLFDYYNDLLSRYEIKMIFSPWCGTDNYGSEGYLFNEEKFLDSKTVSWRKSSTQIDFNKKQLLESYKTRIDLLEGESNISHDRENRFKFKIKNIGKSVWPCRNTQDSEFKFGCRLISASDTKNPVKGEFRTLFVNEIVPNSEEILEITISPPGELSMGEYILKFDVVNEHNFWFEDLGSNPFVLKVTLKNKIVDIG